MSSRRNVLIAGGAGFIGSHLADALIADGANVTVIDSLLTGSLDNIAQFSRERRFAFIEQDVIEPPPASLRVNAVFNLASPASPPHYQADPVHTLMTNVVGTRNLLALAADQGARFLLASTSEVYGDPEVHPQREDYLGNVNPIGPRACYDEGKRAAETLAYDFRRTRGADIRVARIFNTSGPRMQRDDGRVVSNVICQALADDDITVHGDGSQTRSFCYVDDLVEGLLKLMAYEGPDLGPVNLGNPNELTIRELVALVMTMTGSSARIVQRPLPVDDPKRRRPDVSRARKLLGWEPKIPLETGLRQTIAWFANAGAGRDGEASRGRPLPLTATDDALTSVA